METMKNISVKLSPKVTLALTLFFIGIIYIGNLPVNYDFDGTVFSQYLRYAVLKNDLVLSAQPQHPLYIPVNYLFYKTLNTVTGYSVLEYFHLQLFSLCFGLLTLWVSYKFIREITKHRLYPLMGIALIAFLYGNWYYAVEAEVHMAGLFFIAAGMYLLFFKPGDPDTWSRTLGAALCFALAAAFHLANGLIAFGVLLIFLLEKRPFGKILRFFSIYGAMVIGVLALLALTSRQDPLAHYKSQILGNDTLAGQKISYWTGFSLKSLWESIQSVIHGILPSTPPGLSVLAHFIFLAMAAVIILAAVKAGKNGTRKTAYRLGCWMLPYFIFFTFWDHRNTEFKLNFILPFMILFVVSLASLTRVRQGVKTGLLGLLIVSVFLLNYYFFLRPANDIRTNHNYLVAEAIGKATPPNAVIVIGGCGTELSKHNTIYIPYFAFRETFKLDWMLGKNLSLEDIANRLKQEEAKGKPVYVFSEILHESKTLDRLFKNHNLQSTDYFAFLAGLNLHEKIPLVDGYYLKRTVTPTASPVNR